MDGFILTRVVLMGVLLGVFVAAFLDGARNDICNQPGNKY